MSGTKWSVDFHIDGWTLSGLDADVHLAAPEMLILLREIRAAMAVCGADCPVVTYAEKIDALLAKLKMK
jgi:hypothetical protein